MNKISRVMRKMCGVDGRMRMHFSAVAGPSKSEPSKNAPPKPYTSSLGKGVDLIDNSSSTKMIIKGYSETSFLLNDVLAHQSVLVLPKSFLLWNAREFKDITKESLSLFTMVHPRLEILLVGCGEILPGRLPREITEHFKSLGIIVEACSTMHAASTFNILSSEDRHVAAALLAIDPLKEGEAFEK